MSERERGAGRDIEHDRSETVAPPAGLAGGMERKSASAPGRLAPRPETGMPFTDALDDVMREHHTVFAALAK